MNPDLEKLTKTLRSLDISVFGRNAEFRYADIPFSTFDNLREAIERINDGETIPGYSPMHTINSTKVAFNLSVLSRMEDMNDLYKVLIEKTRHLPVRPGKAPKDEIFR